MHPGDDRPGESVWIVALSFVSLNFTAHRKTVGETEGKI